MALMIAFIFLAVLYLATSQLYVVLPSGAKWKPALTILMVCIFLFAPWQTALIAIPGIVFSNLLDKSRLYQYILSIFHVAVGFFVSASLYRWLLSLFHASLAPANASDFGVLVSVVVVTLMGHLVVNRFFSALIISVKQKRRLGVQLWSVMRELHVGYLCSYLVTAMVALLCFAYGWTAVLLGVIVQFGIYQLMKFYSGMRHWQNTALTDGLTGVQNRLAWNRFVENYEPGKMLGTLALIDIDGFKRINDTHGHLVGDEVLRDLTKQLKVHLPKAARVFRVGGDEFVIYYPMDEGNEIDLNGLLEHAFGATHKKWERLGVEFKASVGEASIHAESRRLTDVMRIADESMYDTKRHRRATGHASV